MMEWNLYCSLPKPVKRRVKALKKIQFNMLKLESKFYEEVHQLECKYADMYAPFLEQVNYEGPIRHRAAVYV